LLVGCFHILEEKHLVYAAQVEEMPVQEEFSFHHLARQICDLLDCQAAYLLPGCPEPALRHPLLDLLALVDYAPTGMYCSRGPVDLTALLEREDVRARCDLAAQSGGIQCLAAFPGVGPFQRLAIIPLQRPAGLLGIFLLLDERPEAFTHGDMLVLNGYLPSLTERLERELRSLVSPALTQQLSRLRQQWEDCQQVSIAQEREESDLIDNKFLSMVMHELRTPLAAIKGYTALLQTYPAMSESFAVVDQAAGRTNGEHRLSGASHAEVVAMTPERQQRYLATIMEQVTHLEVLVRDLLDISRIHAGRLSLRSVPVDLAQLCQRVVELLQPRVQQHAPACDLRCVLPPDLPPVWADPDRVQQALANLLENAVKYSPNGGVIEVYVSLQQASQEEDLLSPALAGREGQAIAVTVRDHGVGIAAEQQVYLFKPFHRLEHPLTGDVGGAGLGLYITRKFIQAMGGQIKLESRAGEGTTVTFTLPVYNHTDRNTELQNVCPAIAKRHPVCYSVSNTK
jgi:signal transduction histidine kinase